MTVASCSAVEISSLDTIGWTRGRNSTVGGEGWQKRPSRNEGGCGHRRRADQDRAPPVEVLPPVNAPRAVRRIFARFPIRRPKTRTKPQDTIHIAAGRQRTAGVRDVGLGRRSGDRCVCRAMGANRWRWWATPAGSAALSACRTFRGLSSRCGNVTICRPKMQEPKRSGRRHGSRGRHHALGRESDSSGWAW